MQIAGFAYAALEAIRAAGSLELVAWTAFCQAAAPVLVRSIWQSAVIGAGLAGCLRLLPRISAMHRFLVWAAGFAAMVALPFGPLLLPRGSASAAGPVLGQAAAYTWLQLNIGWGLAIVLVWAGASIYRLLDLAIHSIRLRRLWMSATPVRADDNLPAPLRSVACRFPGRRVEVCTTEELENPSVIGFFSPRILIPEWLLNRMTAEELDQVLLHEAEHMRRGDDWTNLLQKLGLVLFPLNPALAWVERQLCLEREMACDEAVVKATRAPRAYASCLASLAERGREHRAEALSLGAWQSRSELARRVHGILARRDGLGSTAAFALLLVLGSGLLLGSVELCRCPELVAFLPDSDVQLTARTEATRPQEARLVNTGFTQALAREGADSGLRAVQTVATVRDEGSADSNVAKMAVRRKISTRTDGQGKDELRPEGPSPGSSANASKAVMASAESSRPEAAPAIEEQWIVFTAWEQTATVNLPAESTQHTGAWSNELGDAQPKAQGMGQGTVTRLVVRILPANFTTGRPGVARFSNGWLVLQL